MRNPKTYAELTDDDREFIRLMTNQAAYRNVDVVEYTKALITTLEDGFTKYPGDFQSASEYASALLNGMYPIPKEAAAHE